jgi:ATP-dependent Clp protease ATP-binding subunit ClpC
MVLADILAELLGDFGALFRSRKTDSGPEFTPRLRQVFAGARSEAVQRACPQVDTTQFLLALARFERSAGCDSLRRLGVDPKELVRALESVAMPKSDHADGQPPPYSDQMKKCFAVAIREANSMGHRYIGTDHMILGVLRVGGKHSAALFATRGLSLDKLRNDIRAQTNRASQEDEIAS